MTLISVNVSGPRDVEYEGRIVSSSIWKEPVEGAVAVGTLGLHGDRQANPAVHGGAWKAAYAYSADHYPWWGSELARADLTPGMFGENLTIGGLDEQDIRIGDTLTIGTVEFQVTGPRIPCSNLAVKFGDRTVPRRFTAAARPGIYLRVARGGHIAAGQQVRHARTGSGADIRTVFSAITDPRGDRATAILRDALVTSGIDPDLAHNIRKRIV